MQGIYAWFTGKGNMKCNGIQGIYALLTGGESAFFISVLS